LPFKEVKKPESKLVGKSRREIKKLRRSVRGFDQLRKLARGIEMEKGAQKLKRRRRRRDQNGRHTKIKRVICRKNSALVKNSNGNPQREEMKEEIGIKPEYKRTAHRVEGT